MMPLTPTSTRYESETGGLNPLHDILKKPLYYSIWKISVALASPLELSSSENKGVLQKMGSAAARVSNLALRVISLSIHISLLTVTLPLATASFLVKEFVQLFVKSTITDFGKLDRNPGLWKTVDCTAQDVLQPLKSIIVGAASCDYQVRGPHVPQDNPELYEPLARDPQQDAHWRAHDEQFLSKEELENYIAHSQWEDVDKVIQAATDLKISSLRISPPESLYPNQAGEFNEEAIQCFKEILEKLQKAGISIHFTGFHFTYPQYIEGEGKDKRDIKGKDTSEVQSGYLKKENRDIFVSYMKRMFKEFHPYVRAWCTINEPAVFAMQKYFRGVHAGGELNFQKAAELMICFLQMHQTVYRELKKMEGGKEAIIGFSHDVIEFKPHGKWNPIEHLLCSFLTHVFHKAYLDYYRTGVFEMAIPIPSIVSYALSFLGITCPSGVYAKWEDPNFDPETRDMDSIFLQVYGRPEMSLWSLMTTGKPYEHPDLYHPGWGCPADPYAIMRGVQEVWEATKKPIEITETGCPLHKAKELNEADQQAQATYFRRAFYVVSQALQEGYPIRALYFWSFLGNFPRHDANGDLRAEWWEWDERTDYCFALMRKTDEDQAYQQTTAGTLVSETIQKIRES